jgi:hypothetical protein
MHMAFDPTTGGTPRGEGRASLRLADAHKVRSVSDTPQTSDTSDLAQVITALRARIDEEFRMMERLDTKARQAFALVAGFFAVVQAVTFGSFAQGGVNPTERVFLAIAAILAGALVLWAGHLLREVEELQREPDINPRELVSWYEEATEPDHVARNLASGLKVVAEKRFDNNLEKTKRLKTLDSAARCSLILTSLELMLAIVFRV